MDEKRKQLRRLLWRWGRVTIRCATLQKEIRQYINLINGAADMRIPMLTGMPHGSDTGDPTPLAANKLDELKRMYARRIDEIQQDIEAELRFCRAMDTAIRSIDVQEARILEMRYKREMSHERIATETSYSKSQIKRIEQEAVDNLARVCDVDTF